MAAAVELAKLGDPVAVDWALGHAAVHGRFAEADLSSILAHHAQARDAAGPACIGQRGPQPDPGHRRLGRPRQQHQHQPGDAA